MVTAHEADREGSRCEESEWTRPRESCFPQKVRKRIRRMLLKSKEFIRKYLWGREKIACLSDYGRVGANIAEEVKNPTSSIIS